jgi:FixJ family two-component response regulator
MSEKVLFVDDEQSVLDGFVRLLHKEFEIRIALGGERGLKAISQYGPFAVVISDMRMPEMNGAEFLAEVRQQAPETVRMLLTGDTDLKTAIDAVNQGQIFRFLSKPCKKEDLVSAIQSGLEQYRSTVADKKLIEKALVIEHATPENEAEGLCKWDNYEGPTGLPGPTQAKSLLAPYFGGSLSCYVILYKVAMLHVVEQNYGGEIADDHLNFAAQFLMQGMHAEDKLFHWEKDVLMSVVLRQLSPVAMRMEVARMLLTCREHVIDVNGKSLLITSPITFDLLSTAQFANMDEMLMVFSANSVKKDL